MPKVKFGQGFTESGRFDSIEVEMSGFGFNGGAGSYIGVQKSWTFSYSGVIRRICALLLTFVMISHDDGNPVSGLSIAGSRYFGLAEAIVRH